MAAAGLKAQETGPGLMRVWGKCKFTGEEYECTVPADGLTRYLNGEPVQVALPQVSVDDREFLISGISPKGWKKVFG